MAELPNLSVLGTGPNRLARRKRVNPRSPQRTEVNPAILPVGLATPLNQGCDLPTGGDDLDIKVTKQEKEIILARTRQRLKNLPILEPESVVYSLFSHEELQNLAVFKVTKSTEEGLRSVNDPRGGVVDNDKMCATCQSDNLTCPGHYGIIELYQPIIHPLFRREVIDILMSVCNSCGGLLVPREILQSKGILELTGSKRLRAIALASEKAQCRQDVSEEGVTGCIPNPFYKTSSAKDFRKIFYSYEGKKGKDNIRTVEEIQKILKAISPEDAATLGFENGSHPSRFIMESLPVIPICARAPVIQDGVVLNDDLTSMYMDIVGHNLKLAKTDISEKDRETALESLIFSIEHMIDNADSRYRQGTKKAYLDIKGRIQGKEAIIRNLIQGKRVNYSSRTVLGPDPNLKFGQIRIPKIMAPYLTYPETVSPQNIGRLTKLLKEGHITHITPAKGKFADRRLKVDEKRTKETHLGIGDKVDRWLQNGDYVVFNRQPTLHKQGIMGYEVVLGDPLTIGLHLSYTPAHNAD